MNQFQSTIPEDLDIFQSVTTTIDHQPTDTSTNRYRVGITGNNLNVNIPNVSNNSILGRDVWVNLRGSVTYNLPTGFTFPTIIDDIISLRDFAFQRCVSTADVSIGNAIYNTDVFNVMNHTVKMIPQEYLTQYGPGCGGNCASIGTIGQSETTNNALEYYTSVANPNNRRYSGISQINRVSDSSVNIVFDIMEPLIVVSPFLPPWEAIRSKGFFGQEDIYINMNLLPGGFTNLLISHSDGFNAEVLQTVLGNFEVELITTNSVLPSEISSLPKTLIYETREYDYATSVISTPDTSASTFSDFINTKNLNSIPDFIVIHRPRQYAQYSDKLQIDNNSIPINSVSITFNNKTGLLSNLNALQLSAISKKNGLKHRFGFNAAPIANGAEFLILTPQDLGLSEGLCIGCQTNSSFACQVTYNRYASGIDLTGNTRVIFVYNSITRVEDGIFRKARSYFQSEDVQDALRGISSGERTLISRARLVGGNFWTTLLSIGSRIVKGIGSFISNGGIEAIRRGWEAATGAGIKGGVAVLTAPIRGAANMFLNTRSNPALQNAVETLTGPNIDNLDTRTAGVTAGQRSYNRRQGGVRAGVRAGQNVFDVASEQLNENPRILRIR